MRVAVIGAGNDEHAAALDAKVVIDATNNMAGAHAFHSVDALATLWFALAFGQQRGRRVAIRLLGLDS